MELLGDKLIYLLLIIDICILVGIVCEKVYNWLLLIDFVIFYLKIFLWIRRG